jgi:hypothetical protein
MGFSSFSSYGSKISGLGKARVALGSLGSISKSVQIFGGTGGVYLSYDKGLTYELPNTGTLGNGICGFDGKLLVTGGNNSISWSSDFGRNWVVISNAVPLNIQKIIYIKETKVWFAVGICSNTSNRTIARSLNGIDWTLLETTVFNRSRCYSVCYNVSTSTYTASGYSNIASTASSSDGIIWNLNTGFTFPSFKEAYYMFFDGTRYILGGLARQNNIATSLDGVSWGLTGGSIDIDIRSFAYNGKDTYVAVGTQNGFRQDVIQMTYWSNDLITWFPANDNLLGLVIFYVEWNGTYFIASGYTRKDVSPAYGNTTAYSIDGKNWTKSLDNPFGATTYSGTTYITYNSSS